MKISLKSGAVLVALLAASPAWARNEFKSMAKELSKDARKAGIESLAVFPFLPTGGDDGWIISEKLTTQIVAADQVQVVERRLLKQVFDEHHLGLTGALDQSKLKELGKILPVDGIVSGSFIVKGSEVVIEARLINVKTGLIVGAVERQVEKDWSHVLNSQSDSKKELASIWVPVPEITVEAPPIPDDVPAPSAEAGPSGTATGESCDGAAEQVNNLNRQILDIKARYWALWVKNGKSMAEIRDNPGSEIMDPFLKAEFYQRMNAWYHSKGDIPELTSDEMTRFTELDSRALKLYYQCGLGG